MSKKDGHTHTQFCPHGSGDDAELMIQKAIKMGFEEYSITEHAPLPPDFAAVFAGQRKGLTTAALSAKQFEPYLEFVQKMQLKYRERIKINAGFEVDYLPGFEEWTKSFLESYGSQTQDNVLSVHFMRGTDDKFWCLDYSTSDFAQGFAELLRQPQELFRQFFKLELAAASSDLGSYRPQRLGHLTLIRKYQDYFNLPQEFDAANQHLIAQILETIKQKGLEIDLNTAGLYKEYCNEIYPSPRIVEQAVLLEIPLVYGSDAHSILEVGHGWHEAIDVVKRVEGQESN